MVASSAGAASRARERSAEGSHREKGIKNRQGMCPSQKGRLSVTPYAGGPVRQESNLLIRLRCIPRAEDTQKVFPALGIKPSPSDLDGTLRRSLTQLQLESDGQRKVVETQSGVAMWTRTWTSMGSLFLFRVPDYGAPFE